MTPTPNLDKIIASSGVTLTNVFTALDDKKVTLPEVMAIFGSLMPFAGVDYAQVAPEFQGADAEAKAALIGKINDAITLPNKATEAKAEAVLAMFVYSQALIPFNTGA